MQPTLKVSDIVSGPNHRQYFDPQAMKELEAGIRAAGGVTQPILVRPHPEREGVFEIMAGERRWRAALAVHGDDYEMPVVIRDASDAEARSLGIIENHFRDATSDVEQAEGARVGGLGRDGIAGLDRVLGLLEQREKLLTWIRTSLDAVARERAGDPGPVVLRRLSKRPICASSCFRCCRLPRSSWS